MGAAPRNRSAKRQFEVIATLERAFPADDIVGLYEEALALARKHKSWKGVLAVADAINDRLIGRPAQVVIHEKRTLADLLAEAREERERMLERRAENDATILLEEPDVEQPFDTVPAGVEKALEAAEGI